MRIVRYILFAAITGLASTPSHAESLSTCDEVKKESGMAEYLKCIARQNFKNYVPGGGSAPGMAMDEIDTKVDEVLDGICHGEGTVCDGEPAGTKIGNCTC